MNAKIMKINNENLLVYSTYSSNCQDHGQLKLDF